MTRSRETTPLLSGESLMSWVARTGRDRTGLDPSAFLDLVGLTRRDVIAGTPACLDRLAEVGEVSRESLERGGCATIDRHLQACRGERFHGDFAGRGRTTFCPSCLLDDARPYGPSRGRRVGRLAWLFSPVRTCAVHRIPLVRFPNASPGRQFQDMDAVVPADADLEALAAAALPRMVSPLQAYVEARLEGAASPAWLDGQRIDQAAIASEMVGASVLHGTRFARRAFT